MNVITGARGGRLEMDVKCLHDEVMTLKMAIEEAIMRRQKSLDLLGDIPESGVIHDEDSAMICADAGLVGSVDDF